MRSNREWRPGLGFRIAALTTALAAVVACGQINELIQQGGPSSGNDANARMESSVGGLLSLADGARLQIPAGALPEDVDVSLRGVEASDATGGTDGFTIPVGKRYEVDLGGQALLEPVTLEIPFDREAVPQGEDPGHVFLTYFDEGQGRWMFAGGQVDLGRDVIAVSAEHASWWQPSTWNWEAWSAALNDILSANVVSIFEGVALLVQECPQEGQFITVDASEANGLVQGCIERDDPDSAALRVVNPTAIYVEVQPTGDARYFDQTLLSPGESLRFAAHTGDPSPLVISADVTQMAGLHLAIHMTIAMLPGFNQLGGQGRTVACLTERLADATFLVSASEALLQGNGAAAAEHIARMYQDEDVMRRFITAADDCGYGPAATWSLPGIRMVGASLATIQSSAEFIPRFLLNSHGEVRFLRGPAGVPGEVAGVIAYYGQDEFGNPVDLRVGRPDETGVVVIPLDDLEPEEFIPGWPCPEFSPDGRLLAYSRTRFEELTVSGGLGEVKVKVPRGTEELAVVDLTTGETLADVGEIHGSFDWSPDGLSLAFGRPVQWGNDYFTPIDPQGVWKLEVSTGTTTMLVAPGAGQPLLHPQWSPRGDKIAFHEAALEGWGAFGLADADGANFSLSDDVIGEFDWSPDGSKIVYDTVVYAPEQGSGLYILDIDTGVSRSIYRDARVSAMAPRWSPDGTMIAFTAFDSLETGKLMILDMASGLTNEVTATGLPSISYGEWGPDSEELVVSTLQRDLFVVPIGGGDPLSIGSGGCPRWGLADEIAYGTVPAGVQPTPQLPKTEVIYIGNPSESKIEFEGGVSCGYMGGATRVYDGDRMNYLCSNGWFVLGDPRKGEVWTVRMARLSSNYEKVLEEKEVSVTKIWYWE